MSLVYIIEDDQIMADCLALSVRGATETLPDGTESDPPEVMVFNDAVSAISSIDSALPDVILLDVLLSGPDGFTFLNELISYHDTARIPVALITSLNLAGRNLEHYGVFRILNKETMTPADIQSAVYDGVAISEENRNAVAPELALDQPIAAQIEQFSPQNITGLRNALEAISAPEGEVLSSTPVDNETDFSASSSSIDELSPEALAIINGDASTAMDTAFGMPPTNIDANTDPVVLSNTEVFENPAESLDFLEIPHDGDTF